MRNRGDSILSKLKTRFIFKLYSSDFENSDLLNVLESSNAEELRCLVSKGHWLNELISSMQPNVESLGLVPEIKGGEAVKTMNFLLRFSKSTNSNEKSRVNQIWEQLNVLNTPFARQSYIRKLVFYGYAMDTIFSDKQKGLFNQLFTRGPVDKTSAPPVDVQPSKVEPKTFKSAKDMMRSLM